MHKIFPNMRRVLCVKAFRLNVNACNDQQDFFNETQRD